MVKNNLLARNNERTCPPFVFFFLHACTAWPVGVVGLALSSSLVRAGVYLTSNPHSSFFYLLTGVHGVHLLGGLVALSVILPRAWRERYAPPASTAVDATAIYWHFLTVLWLYLFILLYWL